MKGPRQDQGGRRGRAPGCQDKEIRPKVEKLKVNGEETRTSLEVGPGRLEGGGEQ